MSAPKKKPQRRRRHGSAWYWKQTDCWYHTPTGTKRRVPLFDGDGKRIRGVGNKQAAGLAMARLRLQSGARSESEAAAEPSTPSAVWTVARVCSAYIEHSQRAATAGRMHPEYCRAVSYYLNEFCSYCGALQTTELKRGDVAAWVESRSAWRSPATRRNVITMILAAFNYAQREHDIRNPLKGLKKPPHRPRLQSFPPEEERAIYREAPDAFRDFLFVLIHTGLRPFSELAKLTAADVEETPRGMMWRVYASKTRKTRKIPIRPDVAELTRRLLRNAAHARREPLFRNSHGKPWTKANGKGRFRLLKQRLHWFPDDPRARYSCYTCRHTFAHRMLSGYWNGGVGCSIEVLAELLGDTPKVAFDHYGKEWGRHYQDPLWAALGFESEKHKRRQ